ncbi:MAG: hypothetical protein ACKO1U_09215 [Bacteroidota bacterium]
MARPKKKSSLIDGVTELVEALRSMHAKLDEVIKHQKKHTPKRKPGRPKKAGKRGRPAGKRKPGRPPGKRGPGRPRKNAIKKSAEA